MGKRGNLLATYERGGKIMSADEHQYTYDAPYVSNCCGMEVYCDTDICSDCKEHCLLVSYEEPEENDTNVKFKYQ